MHHDEIEKGLQNAPGGGEISECPRNSDHQQNESGKMEASDRSRNLKMGKYLCWMGKLTAVWGVIIIFITGYDLWVHREQPSRTMFSVFFASITVFCLGYLIADHATYSLGYMRQENKMPSQEQCKKRIQRQPMFYATIISIGAMIYYF